MGASGRVFWSLVILVMVALVGALPLAVRHRFEGVWIPSTSMAPTLLVGDYVLVDKATRWPTRGDLVVFTDPGDANELLVKRIVGLGGEEITVQGHDTYINCAPREDGCRPVAEPSADWSDEVRAVKDVGPVEIPVRGHLRDGRQPQCRRGQPPLGAGVARADRRPADLDLLVLGRRRQHTVEPRRPPGPLGLTTAGATCRAASGRARPAASRRRG
jgi:signal peptidase I